MIEDFLNIDIRNIQPHHNEVMLEMDNYIIDLEVNFQLYTEYEEVNGIEKIEYIRLEQERLYTIIGTTSALLQVYNNIEQYELSQELYNKMKTSFCIVMNETYPNTNNEDKFYHLIDSMIETFKTIFNDEN